VIAAGKHQFPLTRPHAHRDPSAKIVNVAFTLDDSAHRYIERINIRGNTVTATGDPREFDVARRHTIAD
jgi:outer membrane protein assembly factor BamA